MLLTRFRNGNEDAPFADTPLSWRVRRSQVATKGQLTGEGANILHFSSSAKNVIPKQ